MILTGKAKEYFETWVNWKYPNIEVLLLGVVEPVFLNALIVEWFDSVGIYINIIYEEFEDVQVKNLPIKIKTWSAWVNDEVIINFNSRQEATEGAIKKACEIYNKN